MKDSRLDILRFEEAYFERIWGGDRLRSRFGKPVPEDMAIGEAWLISDHPQFESVVAEGSHRGRTLGQLVETYGQALLGTLARPTAAGRFPLLLKILDAADVLSVQVHPDDACAARLGEPDVGKTEMWHVLEANPGAELIAGLDPSATRETVARSVENGAIERLMGRFPARPGVSLFVPAGTIHAIGAGNLLAEIQQNSDLTYRLYDWGRLDPRGRPRALHIEKALETVHFGETGPKPAEPLRYERPGATRAVAAVCRHFAAEIVSVSRTYARSLPGTSFRLLLGKTGRFSVSDGTTARPLEPGAALLVPAAVDRLEIEGQGEWLEYYVPDIERDIVAPLRAAGHDDRSIARLVHV